MCKMITSASRPISVGFQRLEKAIKSDFRKGAAWGLRSRGGFVNEAVTRRVWCCSVASVEGRPTPQDWQAF